MSKLKDYSLKDLLELFDEHDKGFIIEGSEVFEVSISNTNLPKIFLCLILFCKFQKRD